MNNCCEGVQLNIQISQDGGAKDLRRRDKFCFGFFHSSLTNVTVKELLKSVRIWKSYHKIKVDPFHLGHGVRVGIIRRSSYQSATYEATSVRSVNDYRTVLIWQVGSNDF